MFCFLLGMMVGVGVTLHVILFILGRALRKKD